MVARKYETTCHLHFISPVNGVALEYVTVISIEVVFPKDLIML